MSTFPSSPEASNPAWRWTNERRSGVFSDWADRAPAVEEEGDAGEEELEELKVPSAALASASVPAASAFETTALLALTTSPPLLPASLTPTTLPLPSSEKTRDSTLLRVETTPPRRSTEAASALATAEAPPSGNWSREELVELLASSEEYHSLNLMIYTFDFGGGRKAGEREEERELSEKKEKEKRAEKKSQKPRPSISSLLSLLSFRRL